MRPFPLLCALALGVAAPSLAQPAGSAAGDMPMGDYLALLARIAPAAREGAQAYVDAHARRCGRALSAQALRHAMSQAGGDPVLMGMIRASQTRDTAAIVELSHRLHCEDGR